MAFIPIAEVGGRLLRPLIRLGEQHAVPESLVDVAAQRLQEPVSFGQILAIGALTLSYNFV